MEAGYLPHSPLSNMKPPVCLGYVCHDRPKEHQKDTENHTNTLITSLQMWYLQNGSVSRQPLGHVPSKVQTLLHFCFMLLPMRHWWPPKWICYCNYLRGREGEIPQMKDWKTIFLIISCHLWLRNAGMENSCNSWGKLANRVPSGHQGVTMLAYVADFPCSVSCILKLLASGKVHALLSRDN